MSNRINGTRFETKLCRKLFGDGFWVHNMAQNQAGQPADVIAVKNGRAFLIDCKDCVNDAFPFSRIEPNQRSAMALWESRGNGRGYFALRTKDKDIRMISLPELDKLAMLGYKSISGGNLYLWTIDYEDWLDEVTYYGP